MERVVATDLEGTLTEGSTWRGVGRYLSEHGQRGRYRRFLYLRLPQVFLAQRGFIDVQAFRERWMRDLTALLRGKRQDEVEAMADWVFEHELWPSRREDVIAELGMAREGGARLIVASGTYTPIAERFAARLGAAAMGTDLAYDAEGRATGRFAGTMGTGEEKVARLRAMLGDGTLETAYGDTMADVPMLSLATVGIVVHPDAALRRVAVERGWRVIGAAE
jgi:HAD superfamily phosphoserine phosphatase-like hydrolase